MDDEQGPPPGWGQHAAYGGQTQPPPQEGGYGPLQPDGAPNATYPVAGARWDYGRDGQFGGEPQHWPPNGDPAPDYSPAPPTRRPRSGQRRAAIAAAVAVVAVVAAAAGLALRHTAAPASASAAKHPMAPAAPPRHPAAAPAAGQPVALAEAKQVIARYAAINNQANAALSGRELAKIEAGTALQMDVGTYKVQAATPGSVKTAPFTWLAADKDYFIPTQAAWPHWFMVRAQSAVLTATSQHPDSPPRPSGNYVVMIFTQASAGASWTDILEPVLEVNPGTPQVTITAGHATAVSSSTQGLAVSPDSIAQATATALDHGGGQTIVNLPTALAERQAQSKLEASGGSGFIVTTSHLPAGPVFGVRTTNGGAILVYGLYAQLNARNASGARFELNVPGYYDNAVLAEARLGYVDELLVYDPPAPSGSPARVIGAASSIAFQGNVP